MNAAALAKLGDSAVFDGVSVIGRFIPNPAITLGILCEKPVFELAATSAGSSPRGKTLIVNGKTYTVSVPHKEDANGFKLLELDLA